MFAVMPYHDILVVTLATGKYARHRPTPMRNDSRILHCFPGTLQEHPMRGLGRVGLGPGDVKKCGVEVLDIVKYRLGAYVPWILVQIAAGSRTAQLVDR
jgi:hypothetical protein